MPEGAWKLAAGMGSTAFLAVASLVLGYWLWRRGDRLSAGLLAFAFLGAYLLDMIAKIGFGRARPGLADPTALGPDPLHFFSWDPSSGAFPSGHAMQSIVVYGFLVAVMQARLRPWVGVVSLVLVLAIGMSRIELGAHWPTDVLGGWLIGIAWLASVLVARRRAL